MRLTALFVSVLMFGACGGNEARVDLPLQAPEGAHPLVQDFVEICSLRMSDRPASLELAKERGWISDSPSEEMAMKLAGAVMLANDDHPEALLQLILFSVPHLDSSTCMIMWPRFDDPENEIKLDVIHEIDGLQGGYTPIPGGDGSGMGRWSFIADNGQTVTLNAMKTMPLFLQLQMSTHKHLTPSKN